MAFDAHGRVKGWLLGDDGRPDDIAEGLEDEVLASLSSPSLRGGCIAFGLHYSYANDDEQFRREWTPTPVSWHKAAEALGGSAELVDILNHIFKDLPAPRPRIPFVPLSKAMDPCFGSDSPDAYATFVQQFASSHVGAIVRTEHPDNAYVLDRAGNPISLGTVKTPDGRTLVLLFADPWEFAPRYGLQFDAIVSGAEVLSILHKIPAHPGVVVSSATTERSLQITPALLDKFVGDPASS